jgi:hypothetical protein
MTMTKQHTDSVLIQQMKILKGDNTMTKTPDYNDGHPHWWNSPAAPEGVHPKSTMKVAIECGNRMRTGEQVIWREVAAFQVIKQHVEPRVWWVNIYRGGTTSGLYETEQEALKLARAGTVWETIRVVEQPESDT